MEDPSSPEHPAVVGRDNVRESACNGIRVDGEWYYQ